MARNAQLTHVYVNGVTVRVVKGNNHRNPKKMIRSHKDVGLSPQNFSQGKNGRPKLPGMMSID